ncbi:PKD domain-containing protein [Larkinella rosea]|uniref:PKD domain-containing protein n=1 Tax=Larkinella rosea TaxID=2025312 RepID=A0A3P1BN17_9BACT|nr:PKD domain-containing protein [Larkinella rosea]RRB02477.1 PKD domain-containing protein [Larkinella rosea]
MHRLMRFSFPGKLMIYFLAATLLVAGCKTTEPGPTEPLQANAGPDQPVQVGQPVTLDGTASKDGPGKPLTYQWAILRKPAKSVVTLALSETARPTFTPDEVGEYELRLTVSNGAATSFDNVLVLASTAQPLTIDRDITVKTVLEDRILNPNLPDYIVPKSIAVKHELTIQPGVVIAFERDVRFDINDEGGILIAKGTAEKKIRFIGVGQTKGYWAGIMVYSESNVNVMEQADLFHAGSRPMLDNKKVGMALFKESQMALKNTLFAQNDGYGLFVQETALLREFSTNAFSNNTEAGILLSTENVAKLDAASIFTGNNGRNVVEINGDYIGNNTTKNSEIVWGGFADKTPYRLLNSVAVRSGWKLNPGVTLEIARDASIIVNEEGYLLAKGTANQKVIFTGAANASAYWQGILSHSVSAQNSIEHAEITNAGSKVIISGKRANVALYGNHATITIRNTRISGSGGHGIWVGYGSTINADAATSNTFDSNAQTAVEVEE